MEDFTVPQRITIDYVDLTLYDLALDAGYGHTARYENQPARKELTINFNSKESFEKMLKLAGATYDTN